MALRHPKTKKAAPGTRLLYRTSGNLGAIDWRSTTWNLVSLTRFLGEW